MYFTDREDAAKQLATKLDAYAHNPNAIVVGLPRGGVVTAAVVAKALKLPLDIIVTRKIGAPHNPELAIGAVTEEGKVLRNKQLIADLSVSDDYIAQEAAVQQQEAQRRLQAYRGDRPPLDLSGKTVLLVDDGVATGATMKAAIASAKAKDAKKIVVAVPVAPPETVAALKALVDDIVCLHSPEDFAAIGQFYARFAQVTDDEVVRLLSS